MNRLVRSGALWCSTSIVVCALSGVARADNECGAATAGDSITCDGTTYTVGPGDNIRYRIDGIDLTADGIVVNHANGGQPAVHLRTESSHTGNLIGLLTNVVDFTTGDSGNIGSSNSSSIPGRYSDGLRAEQRGTGEARVTLESSSVITYGYNAMGIYAWQRFFNAGNSSDVSATMSGGTIDTSGRYSHGVYGRTDAGFSNVLVTTGDAEIHTRGRNSIGIRAVMARPGANSGAPTSTGNLTIEATDTRIRTDERSAHGALAESNHVMSTGNATVTLNSAQIETAGDDAFGSGARLQGAGNVRLESLGSRIVTSGVGSHGLFAQAGSGTVNVTVDSSTELRASGADSEGIFAASASADVSVEIGGQVVSGSGAAATVHVLTPAGSEIGIRSTATVDGSASGVALRHGDLDNDGVDEIGGDARITTEGTVTGDALLGLGNDEFTLAGGLYTGDIYGDDLVATLADGDDRFHWQGGDLNSGFYGGNGADTAEIDSAANYEATEIMDGGDDVSGTDGWVDSLRISGVTTDLIATNLLNWEQITLSGGNFINSGAAPLVTGAEGGHGLVLDSLTTLETGPAFNLQGNFELRGELRMDPGATATDVVDVTGEFIGANGRMVMDAVLGGDASPADRVSITGDSSGTTEILVNALGGTGAATTGNGILLVEVSGTSAGTFTLVGEVRAGDFLYTLAQVGNNWYLQSTHNPIGRPAGSGSAEPIPTLSVWLQLLLAGVLAGVASRHQRKLPLEH